MRRKDILFIAAVAALASVNILWAQDATPSTPRTETESEQTGPDDTRDAVGSPQRTIPGQTAPGLQPNRGAADMPLAGTQTPEQARRGGVWFVLGAFLLGFVVYLVVRAGRPSPPPGGVR
jgi:hypothetical protein